MVSSAGAETGVHIRLFVERRDVAGKQTYPEEAQQISQFALPASDEDLSDWVRRIHYAAGVISDRESLPESIHKHELDFDCEGRALLPQDDFVRSVVAGSHHKPLMFRSLPHFRCQSLGLMMRPWNLCKHCPLKSTMVPLTWGECWVVAELSHPASCSARELTTRATPTGWHALVVFKGLIVRTQRVHLVMLESSRSAVISEAWTRPVPLMVSTMTNVLPVKLAVPMVHAGHWNRWSAVRSRALLMTIQFANLTTARFR